MADSRRLAPDRLPTLTEVVDLEPAAPVRAGRKAPLSAVAATATARRAPVPKHTPTDGPANDTDDDWASTESPPSELPIAPAAPADPAAPTPAGAASGAAPSPPAPGPVPKVAPGPMPAATELTAEVLFELESRLDMLFEAQLREALAPALARVADGLIREAREELSARLREMVQDAVARALERHTHL